MVVMKSKGYEGEGDCQRWLGDSTEDIGSESKESVGQVGCAGSRSGRTRKPKARNDLDGDRGGI